MISVHSAVDEAMKIQGWKTWGELVWMATQAAKSSWVIDIGCWRGRTTKAMAAVCPGKIIAVDHASGKYSGDTGRNAILESVPPESITRDFMKNLSVEVAVGKVIPIFENGIVAIGRVRGELWGDKADFAWIDGDHDYEDVKRDIAAYRPLLKPGSLLSGHDYEDSFPGVQRAVRELCPGFKRGLGTSWYVTV